MRGWVAAVGALAIGTSACSVRQPAPPPVVQGVQVGVASWYGPGFHGNRTANGEIYDQYELTAAHPSLPLGTRAIVTNLANGRSVEVRINDRGPFVGGRAIDLSYGAARVIQMVGPGTATVRIEVIGTAPTLVASRVERPVLPAATRAAPVPQPAAPEPAAREPLAQTVAAHAPPPRKAPAPEPPAIEQPKTIYAVEIASFADRPKADHLRGVLSSRFPEAYVDVLEASEHNYYRVRIGPYPMRGVALARAELVTRLGYPAVIEEAPHP